MSQSAETLANAHSGESPLFALFIDPHPIRFVGGYSGSVLLDVIVPSVWFAGRKLFRLMFRRGSAPTHAVAFYADRLEIMTWPATPAASTASVERHPIGGAPVLIGARTVNIEGRRWVISAHDSPALHSALVASPWRRQAVVTP